MRRRGLLLILIALLPAAGTGCQVILTLSDYLHRPKEVTPEHDSALPILVCPHTAYCGSLALLPESPLHAISLAECRCVALARGRVNGSSYEWHGLKEQTQSSHQLAS